MRPYTAPFFFKIRFYQPSDVNPKKNGAHIRYIGTRSGVDLGHEIGSDMELVPDTPEHHIKYAHERPRSHGLFGAGNEEIDMGAIQRELGNHQGMVWRVIVSLHGDDAKRLDMEDREAWEEVIRQQLPRACEEMGISETNLRWVAAYHAEVGHPHAHIVFWEKKPKRRMGKVTPYVKDQMRKKFVQKIYAPDRDRMGKEKTQMRDLMRSQGITTLRGAVDFARSWRMNISFVYRMFALTGKSPETTLTPKADVRQTAELAKKLEALSKLLPGKGRLMLKFMPEQVKDEVRKIAEWLYKQSQFNPLRVRYEEAAEILARPYSNQEKQIQDAVDRAREDMINRMSQIILKAAAEMGRENLFIIHPDRAAEAVQKIKLADGFIPDDREHRLLTSIMKRLHMAGVSLDTSLAILKRLNFEVPMTELRQIFRFAPELPVLGKDIAYLLKGVYGEKEAEQIIKAIGHSDEALVKMKNFKQAPTDRSTLERVFKIQDFRKTAVEQMARFLLSCGLRVDEAKQIILSWGQRSRTPVNEEVIDKALKTANHLTDEATEWGRTPAVGKKEFKEMCKLLNVDLPYPWRSDRERRIAIGGHNKSVANGVFKSAFRHLSALIKRADAEREHAQIQAMNRIRDNVEREQEERERGRGR